jgi:hypothetical protein
MSLRRGLRDSLRKTNYRFQEIRDALVVAYHVAFRGSQHVPRERDVAPPKGWKRYEVRGTASGVPDCMIGLEVGQDRAYERSESPTLIGEFFAPDWNTAKRIYNLLRGMDPYANDDPPEWHEDRPTPGWRPSPFRPGEDSPRHTGDGCLGTDCPGCEGD